MKTRNARQILSASVARLLDQVRRPVSHRRRIVGGGAAAAIAALFAASSTNLHAVNQVWVGLSPVNSNWESAGNFAPGGIAPGPGPDFGDDLFFDGNRRTTNFNNVILLGVNSITFTPRAAPFNIGGSPIFLFDGGITNNSPNLQTVAFFSAAPVGGINIFNFFGPTHIWNAAAGDLLITSDVNFVNFVNLIITGPHNTTISGDIRDPAVPPFFSTLTKNGDGTLTLTGQNTFPGNTFVNGGKLLVNGSTMSMNTFVNPGGTLGGYGVIFGNVFNSGNVNPGASPGKLTIGGDYTQTRDGTLTIEIRGKKRGEHDLLVVSGHANLDGTLRLVKIGKGPRLKVGDEITILTAEQGVNGKFANVIPFETGTIVETGVVYHGSKVVVEGTQGSFAAFAKKFRLTVNQRAVASGLDKIAFRNKEPKLITFLDCRPLEKLPGDFDKIAPDELASIFSTGVALANVQATNLQRRTADIRSGANGFSAAGLAMQGSGPGYAGPIKFRTGAAGPTGNEGKESKEVLPPDTRWGAFLTGVGEWADVGTDGNARGYDISTGGFTLGVDYKVTPNLAVGVNAGYAGTGAHLANGGRVFVNGGKLGLYGTYFDGGFYVDTAINGGYNSYDTRRNALRGDARGSTDGGELNLLVGTGYDWKIGALSIGPTANFQYTYVGLDGFTERGGLAPLSIRSQNGESLRTAFGFKTSYDWRVSGLIIKPELRAAWQHEYGDASFDVASSFAGGGGLFTVRGPEVGRDSLLLGAGFAVLLNERTSTYFYYDGNLGATRYNSHNVSGGVRVAF